MIAVKLSLFYSFLALDSLFPSSLLARHVIMSYSQQNHIFFFSFLPTRLVSMRTYIVHCKYCVCKTFPRVKTFSIFPISLIISQTTWRKMMMIMNSFIWNEDEDGKRVGVQERDLHLHSFKTLNSRLKQRASKFWFSLKVGPMIITCPSKWLPFCVRPFPNLFNFSLS